MRKPFLAVALSAAMVITAVPNVNAQTVLTAVSGGAVTDGEVSTPESGATTSTAPTVKFYDETIGAEDKTSAWWTAFSSEGVKIESGKTVTIDFDNYSDMANVWNSYCTVFTNVNTHNGADGWNADTDYEYAVVRADNWGWGGGDNLSHNGDQIVYTGGIADGEDLYKEIMKDANVKLSISRQGALVSLTAVATSNTDASKTYTRVATFNMDSADADCFMFFVVDNSYMELNSVVTAPLGVAATDVVKYDETIGAEDKTSAWWTAFSKEGVEIESGKTVTIDFDNYSDMANVWNSYNTVFTTVDTHNGADGWNAETDYEYAVIRADNWGWGGGDNLSHNGDQIVYTGGIADGEDLYKEVMKDANVKLSISRQGALVSLTAVATSNTDASKSYTRVATFNMDSADADCYMFFVVDNSYMKLNSAITTTLAGEMPEAPGKGDPVDNTGGTKKTLRILDYSVKTGATKVTGSVNAEKATVTVTVNKKAYKATVSGKKFTAKVAKLKMGDKVTISATAEGYQDASESVSLKGKMKVKKVVAKKNATAVTGSVSVAKATVKVKVGNKAFKKAKVSGKNFSIKVAKLKKGTKVVVTATKKNYKTVSKAVTVK